MKEYGELLGTDEARRFSASVRDVTELLAELGPPRCQRFLTPLAPPRVVYQDACHLRHAQGVRDQPRELLRAVPGLELVEIEGADTCCGSAGIYNLTQPEAARELGRRKALAILAARPDVVATANPGCALQLARRCATWGGATCRSSTRSSCCAELLPLAEREGDRGQDRRDDQPGPAPRIARRCRGARARRSRRARCSRRSPTSPAFHR